ncbi:MAG: STAS domain-containing protein, partial [Polyangia bacterium]
FMKRMAELSETTLDIGTMAKHDLPPGVKLYEVAGPLFFGAAQRAMSALDQISGVKGEGPQSVILFLGQVPAIDATGVVALETTVDKLKRSGNKVILAGMRAQVAEVVARAGLVAERGKLAIAPDLDSALSLALIHSART